MVLTYWDSRREALRVAEERRWIPHWRRYLDAGHASDYLNGRWEERSWLNVPGPFYAAETDTCATGRLAAPSNVLYTDHGQEFIWKQPQNPEQVRAVLDAAYQDPFSGYAWDGDENWTVDLVRQWWAEHERVREWIERQLRNERWLKDPYDRQAVLEALREFKSYMVGALELHLRVYLLWLDTGRRRVTETERLPDL